MKNEKFPYFCDKFITNLSKNSIYDPANIGGADFLQNQLTAKRLAFFAQKFHHRCVLGFYSKNEEIQQF